MQSILVSEIGGYSQRLESNGNIICSCTHGSLYPDNYIDGENICKHIKTYLKNKGEKKHE